MTKSAFLFLFSFCYSFHMYAQELQAKFTVNASRVNSTVDRRIFITLQNQLLNFVNNRKWTTDTYKGNEKIECNFLLNIDNIVETNVFKATLIVQSARPVYGTAYKAAMVNFQDAEVLFKYIEFQPMEFNDNRVQGTDALSANLTAIIAYYAYTVIGLDYDSFYPKGGEPYFQKAFNIVNNAPEASKIAGWKLFDGLRNRYWLNENLVNAKYNLVHDVLYSYYRSGLDKLQASEVEARSNILQSLTQLQAFNQENLNTMIVQFFMQSKQAELVSIFKKASAEEKSKVIQLLSKLDVSNAQRYKDELK
jgi:Domain of unknown function (DUF4835)